MQARSVALLACLAAAAPLSRATSQGASGTIHGVVTDSAGRPVQGATLRISGTETRRTSDANGHFTFEQVQPGRHRLTATMLGARPRFDTAMVRPTDTTRVRFVLDVIPFKPETLPPRFARGARPDTAPHGTERIDLITRVGRLSRLRAHPPGQGRKELRFWLGGPGIPETLVRLMIDGERVDGEVINYLVQAIPERDASPRWRAFMDSVPHWLRRSFHCGPVATDTLHFPGAQAGFRDHLVAVCTRRYRHDVKWDTLLRELEGHHAWTLPDASELPFVGNIVSNGGGVTVESWDGRRYHTSSYSSPHPIAAPEAHDGESIRRALIAFLNRNREIVGPTPP
jgi:hypothetical protein